MDCIEPMYTERFLLRKLEHKDESRIYTILSDPHVRKYLNMSDINTISDASRLIDKYLSGYHEGTMYPFSIIDKTSNYLVGLFVLKVDLFDDDCYEFTVFIDRGFWNRRIYTEILPKMIHFAFYRIKTLNLRGFVMKSNSISSQTLLKHGFTLEKTMQLDGFNDVIESYLLTKSIYFASKTDNP